LRFKTNGEKPYFISLILGSAHSHSSVGRVPASLSAALVANGSERRSGLGGVGIADGVACRQDFQLAMTLIWKNVTHGPEMMVAPHR
jgi:hypothetical protein